MYLKESGGIFNDTFVLFPVDHEHDDYLISLNMISDSINFTVEVKYKQKLTFLDILVRRTEFSLR